MKKIICLSAVAGTGKSGWAKAYIANHKDEKVFVVSSDELRKEITGRYDNLDHDIEMWNLYYERINKIRDENESVTIIADSTNIYNKWRIKIASIPGFDKKTLVILSKPLSMILKNNRTRNPNKFVPEDAIKFMSEHFEKPDYETLLHFDEYIHYDGWFSKERV